MQVPSTSSSAKTPQVPLEKLANNASLSQSQKLDEVSRQFEAVLLRQILGEAQKPVFKSKINGSSMAADVYRDALTNQMADQISRSGSFGLARSLDTQLQRQFKPVTAPNSATPTPPGPGSPVSAPSAHVSSASISSASIQPAAKSTGRHTRQPHER